MTMPRWARYKRQRGKKKRHMFFKTLLSMLLLWGGVGASVYAENRALIISIGLAYRNHGISGIKGPDRDAALAIVLAQKMGFRKAQIKILREEEATKAAILAGLRWLRQGVQVGEQALFYYSGHGTQVPDRNGDEDDQCDEALVPVDANRGNLLLDDELGLYLQELRQRARTVVLIDSCFSGTITRELYVPDNDIVKYYTKGEGSCGRPINVRSLMVTEDTAPNSEPLAGDQLVLLTAAAQNEVAFGDVTRSGRGSLFTQAIYDAIEESASPLSFEVLRDQTAERIRQASRHVNLIAHTPQLEGDPALLRQAFQLTSADPALRPAAEAGAETTDAATFFEHLILGSKFQVAIQASSTKFRVGQEIRFVFRSSKDGYLNLVELQPDGGIQVLFPNGFVSQNQIKSYEEKRIPDDIGGFRFEAQEPLGSSRIIALVTGRPLNFYQRQGGKLIGDFKVLTAPESYALREEVSRAIAIKSDKERAATAEEFGATDITLEVVK